jgi:AhpD family alkylhydroperoxidase
MARIKGVRPAQAGLYVKMAYYFTRRGIAKLTGRETERMIEPLEICAHVPVLFKGYAKLEQATARLHRLDTRLHLLAELKAATLTQCQYCIDMGSAISRRLGLTDEEILALPHQRRHGVRRPCGSTVSNTPKRGATYCRKHGRDNRRADLLPVAEPSDRPYSAFGRSPT